MKINTAALALTAGLFWGASVLIVAIANLVWPDYGREFLGLLASIYPGYRPGYGLASLGAGAGYALVDGAVAGTIFGWLYNLLAGRQK